MSTCKSIDAACSASRITVGLPCAIGFMSCFLCSFRNATSVALHSVACSSGTSGGARARAGDPSRLAKANLTSCDHVTQVSIAKSYCELPNRPFRPHLPSPVCCLMSLLRFEGAGQGPGAFSRRMGTQGTGFFFPHGPKRNNALCSGVLATRNN